MSYYEMAMRFWTEFGLVLVALPLAAVSAKSIAGLLARSFSTIGADAAIHSRPGPASC